MAIKLDLKRFVACMRSVQRHSWVQIKETKIRVPGGDLRVVVFKCERCGDFAINPVMVVE